jgi:acyl-CoA dehydrogenase
MVPSMALEVIDRAIQVHGAMGVCEDTPLAYMFAEVRTLRIADGPDEAHLQQLGRRENRRHTAVQNTFSMRQAKEEQYFRDFRVDDSQKSKL